MRRLIYIFIAVSIVACAEKTKVFESKIFLEKEIYSFIEGNPQWTKNVNSEVETTDKFKRKMIKLSNEPNFLADFPLQLTNISDTTISKQVVKIVSFKAFKDATRSKETLLNNFELEIVGIFSTDQAKSLEINKRYTLKGMLYKQGKRADVKFNHSGKIPIYTLGKYTFWNLEAKPL